MNFDRVILAHSHWRTRFQNFLEGKEKLEAETVAKDNLCELGQWIYGSGKDFAHLPEYVEMVRKHQQFHTTAAQAVTASAKLSHAEALALTQPGSPYALISSACVSAIAKLRGRVENKQ